jgi:hypothetical protein
VVKIKVSPIVLLVIIITFLPNHSASAQGRCDAWEPGARGICAIAIANCAAEDPHIGIAIGANAGEANANAIGECVKNGGGQDCCTIYATIIHGPLPQKTICLAGAQGYNGDFGWGTGTNRKMAISAAISSCKMFAVSPRNCRKTVDVACKTDR